LRALSPSPLVLTTQLPTPTTSPSRSHQDTPRYNLIVALSAADISPPAFVAGIRAAALEKRFRRDTNTPGRPWMGLARLHGQLCRWEDYERRTGSCHPALMELLRSQVTLRIPRLSSPRMKKKLGWQRIAGLRIPESSRDSL